MAAAAGLRSWPWGREPEGSRLLLAGPTSSNGICSTTVCCPFSLGPCLLPAAAVPHPTSLTFKELSHHAGG